jgi:hypothetical protein
MTALTAAAQAATTAETTPAPLEPPAEDQVLVCRARPATDIVLDM